MDIKNMSRISPEGIKERIHGISVIDELEKTLSLAGFKFYISPIGAGLRISTIRNDTDLRGYRYCSWSAQWTKSHKPRRSNCLSWNDWVEFNNLVNAAMDRLNISANITTLGGGSRGFTIRKGMKAMTEDDWEDRKYDNVGSMMFPVNRCDAYLESIE